MIFDLIKKMADRRTGVGFDQLLLLEPPVTKEYDFTYRIFNADGQEVSNVAMVLGVLLITFFRKGYQLRSSIYLATFGGRKLELKKELDGQITVNMGSPTLFLKKFPLLLSSRLLCIILSLAGIQ